MSLRTRYRLLFVFLFTALAFGIDWLFNLEVMRRFPFFFGMIPVLLALRTANYLVKKKESAQA